MIAKFTNLCEIYHFLQIISLNDYNCFGKSVSKILDAIFFSYHIIVQHWVHLKKAKTFCLITNIVVIRVIALDVF